MQRLRTLGKNGMMELLKMPCSQAIYLDIYHHSMYIQAIIYYGGLHACYSKNFYVRSKSGNSTA